jgi:acetyl-CoA carboxylase biotin carboxyl carrier protein
MLSSHASNPLGRMSPRDSLRTSWTRLPLRASGRLPGPPTLQLVTTPNSPGMDLKLIRNLIRVMERGEVTELEIDDEKAGFRVHLKRGPGAVGHGPVVMVPGSATPMAAMPQVPGPAAAPAGAAPEAAPSSTEGLVEITSPMVGTFYRSPSPEAEPFAGSGDAIDDETVVCIVEAMKVMNEIRAETSGTIVEVLVESGEPVEYGQPLFLVKPR